MTGMKDALSFAHDLANKYTAYFDVYRDEKLDDFSLPFYAIYRRRDERYVLSKKIKVYGIENQQLVFATVTDELTSDFLARFQQAVEQHARSYVPEKDEHMSTIVIGMIITDQAVDEKIVKEVKRYRKLKFMKFGFHGWLEIYSALINLHDQSICIHSKGKTFISSIEKMLKGENW